VDLKSPAILAGINHARDRAHSRKVKTAYTSNAASGGVRFDFRRRALGDNLSLVDDDYPVSQFVSFVLLMVIGFGLVFELPVVLFVLGMLRVISSRWLHKTRPYWFLGLGILANFLTPGVDPLTPLIMFIPLYLFYEATALVLKLVRR